jgi:hypothetical protein
MAATAALHALADPWEELLASELGSIRSKLPTAISSTASHTHHRPVHA